MAFRTRRQLRYNRYINAGLQPFEAREWSGIPASKAPWIRKIIRDRRIELEKLERQGKAAGWSKTRIARERSLLITYIYQDLGLVITKRGRGIIKVQGSPDPWQLFRYYRWLMIKDGKWVETPRRKKVHYDAKGIRIEKGDVAAQKTRRRERARQRRAEERRYGGTVGKKK